MPSSIGEHENNQVISDGVCWWAENPLRPFRIRTPAVLAGLGHRGRVLPAIPWASAASAADPKRPFGLIAAASHTKRPFYTRSIAGLAGSQSRESEAFLTVGPPSPRPARIGETHGRLAI